MHAEILSILPTCVGAERDLQSILYMVHYRGNLSPWRDLSRK